MNSYHAVIMLSGWNDQVRGIRELSADNSNYYCFIIHRCMEPEILILLLEIMHCPCRLQISYLSASK